MMNSKKHLLMISYPFPPNPSAGAVRSERFARYLVDYGWNVDVLTIKPQKNNASNHPESLGSGVNVCRTRTLDPWLWMSKRVPKNMFLRAVRSVLMKIFSFPDHMILWIPFALMTGIGLCKRKRIDVIYTTSPPHSSHIIGYLLSTITGIPWVSDFRDPWTLNAYKSENPIDGFLMKLSLFMEKEVYKKSSAILVNTLDNRKKLLDYFTCIDKQKIEYLPNGWEDFPEEIYEIGQKKAVAFTVVHAGTFYPRFRPYAFFYALSDWKRGKFKDCVTDLCEQNIRVILLGASDSETRRLIDTLKLNDVVEIRSWVPQEKAWEIMCSADLLLATLGTGKESATYIPSKLYEYIAAKRPILGFFPEGSASRLIGDTRTGTVFTRDDSLPVLLFLQTMMDKKSSDTNSYNPDERAVQECHVKKRVGELDKILSGLIINS